MSDEQSYNTNNINHIILSVESEQKKHTPKLQKCKM